MKNGQSILKLLAQIFWIAGGAMVMMGVLSYAISSFLLLFGFIWVLTGTFFLCAGSICFIIYKTKLNKKQRLIANGKYISAQIIDIDADPYMEVRVDSISMHPFFVICRYIDGNGREYRFKSGNLLYNPSGLLRSDRLKVYVDLENPGKYYVDTNEILPESAILHKFKFDSAGNARRLMEKGQFLNAITCGVELIGMVTVNGMVKPGFLKLPKSMAKWFSSLPIDEKGRIFCGYTILCKYEAADGAVHIFASKGIKGKPDSTHIGEQVRVYYDGNGYKKYHVDIAH